MNFIQKPWIRRFLLGELTPSKEIESLKLFKGQDSFKEINAVINADVIPMFRSVVSDPSKAARSVQYSALEEMGFVQTKGKAFVRLASSSISNQITPRDSQILRDISDMTRRVSAVRVEDDTLEDVRTQLTLPEMERALPAAVAVVNMSDVDNRLHQRPDVKALRAVGVRKVVEFVQSEQKAIDAGQRVEGPAFKEAVLSLAAADLSLNKVAPQEALQVKETLGQVLATPTPIANDVIAAIEMNPSLNSRDTRLGRATYGEILEQRGIDQTELALFVGNQNKVRFEPVELSPQIRSIPATNRRGFDVAAPTFETQLSKTSMAPVLDSNPEYKARVLERLQGLRNVPAIVQRALPDQDILSIQVIGSYLWDVWSNAPPARLDIVVTVDNGDTRSMSLDLNPGDLPPANRSTESLVLDVQTINQLETYPHMATAISTLGVELIRDDDPYRHTALPQPNFVVSAQDLANDGRAHWTALTSGDIQMTADGQFYDPLQETVLPEVQTLDQAQSYIARKAARRAILAQASLAQFDPILQMDLPKWNAFIQAIDAGHRDDILGDMGRAFDALDDELQRATTRIQRQNFARNIAALSSETNLAPSTNAFRAPRRIESSSAVGQASSTVPPQVDFGRQPGDPLPDYATQLSPFGGQFLKVFAVRQRVVDMLDQTRRGLPKPFANADAKVEWISENDSAVVIKASFRNDQGAVTDPIEVIIPRTQPDIALAKEHMSELERVAANGRRGLVPRIAAQDFTPGRDFPFYALAPVQGQTAEQSIQAQPDQPQIRKLAVRAIMEVGAALDGQYPLRASNQDIVFPDGNDDAPTLINIQGPRIQITASGENDSSPAQIFAFVANVIDQFGHTQQADDRNKNTKMVREFANRLRQNVGQARADEVLEALRDYAQRPVQEKVTDLIHISAGGAVSGMDPYPSEVMSQRWSDIAGFTRSAIQYFINSDFSMRPAQVESAATAGVASSNVVQRNRYGIPDHSAELPEWTFNYGELDKSMGQDWMSRRVNLLLRGLGFPESQQEQDRSLQVLAQTDMFRTADLPNIAVQVAKDLQAAEVVDAVTPKVRFMGAASGNQKYVFHVEYATPSGETLGVALNMPRKDGEGVRLDDIRKEFAELQIVSQREPGSVPQPYSQDLDTQDIYWPYFTEEFIKGPTAEQRRRKGNFTAQERQSVLNTILRVGVALDGQYPFSFRRENIVFRDKNPADAVMVDIGRLRSPLDAAQPAEAFAFIAHFINTYGNRQDVRQNAFVFSTLADHVAEPSFMDAVVGYATQTPQDQIAQDFERIFIEGKNFIVPAGYEENWKEYLRTDFIARIIPTALESTRVYLASSGINPLATGIASSSSIKPRGARSLTDVVAQAGLPRGTNVQVTDANLRTSSWVAPDAVDSLNTVLNEAITRNAQMHSGTRPVSVELRSANENTAELVIKNAQPVNEPQLRQQARALAEQGELYKTQSGVVSTGKWLNDSERMPYEDQSPEALMALLEDAFKPESDIPTVPAAMPKVGPVEVEAMDLEALVRIRGLSTTDTGGVGYNSVVSHVQKLGGDVRISSNSQQGTEVVITLPKQVSLASSGVGQSSARSDEALRASSTTSIDRVSPRDIADPAVQVKSVAIVDIVQSATQTIETPPLDLSGLRSDISQLSLTSQNQVTFAELVSDALDKAQQHDVGQPIAIESRAASVPDAVEVVINNIELSDRPVLSEQALSQFEDLGGQVQVGRDAQQGTEIVITLPTEMTSTVQATESRDRPEIVQTEMSNWDPIQFVERLDIPEASRPVLARAMDMVSLDRPDVTAINTFIRENNPIELRQHQRRAVEYRREQIRSASMDAAAVLEKARNQALSDEEARLKAAESAATRENIEASLAEDPVLKALSKLGDLLKKVGGLFSDGDSGSSPEPALPTPPVPVPTPNNMAPITPPGATTPFIISIPMLLSSATGINGPGGAPLAQGNATHQQRSEHAPESVPGTSQTPRIARANQSPLKPRPTPEPVPAGTGSSDGDKPTEEVYHVAQAPSNAWMAENTLRVASASLNNPDQKKGFGRLSERDRARTRFFSSGLSPTASSAAAGSASGQAVQNRDISADNNTVHSSTHVVDVVKQNVVKALKSIDLSRLVSIAQTAGSWIVSEGLGIITGTEAQAATIEVPEVTHTVVKVADVLAAQDEDDDRSTHVAQKRSTEADHAGNSSDHEVPVRSKNSSTCNSCIRQRKQHCKRNTISSTSPCG